MTSDCVFCRIVAGTAPASVVLEDRLALAIVDLRQFHPGHVVVLPRRHLADVRDLDPETGAALMAAVVRVARAVGALTPGQALSVWHSAGAAAGQEIEHLHVHVHPRQPEDGVLRVYPFAPDLPARDVLDRTAQRLRALLGPVGTG